MYQGHDNATVLVIDDEESTLAVIQAYLTDCGYQVDTAHNGAEALCLLGQERARIALAVVDFRMPGMCGAELLRVIEKRHPGLPAILMSAFGSWVWEFERPPYPWRVGVLIKPFWLTELEALVKVGLWILGGWGPG